MGCGSNRSSNITMPVEQGPSEADKIGIKAVKNLIAVETKPSISPKKTDGKSSPAEEIKQDSNAIGAISINPSQFIFEKNESIYHNYSLREKLGEGNIEIVSSDVT